jgi:hypothetical protein
MEAQPQTNDIQEVKKRSEEYGIEFAEFDKHDTTNTKLAFERLNLRFDSLEKTRDIIPFLGKSMYHIVKFEEPGSYWIRTIIEESPELIKVKAEIQNKEQEKKTERENRLKQVNDIPEKTIIKTWPEFETVLSIYKHSVSMSRNGSITYSLYIDITSPDRNRQYSNYDFFTNNGRLKRKTFLMEFKRMFGDKIYNAELNPLGLLKSIQEKWNEVDQQIKNIISQ